MIRLGRVVKAHKRSDDDPIQVKKGDVVRVSKPEIANDRHDWLWCVGNLGQAGWMPASFMEVTGKQGIALRDFNAIELTVAIGDDLVILDEAAGWYWAQNKSHKHGWVPVDCVALDFV